MTEEIIINGIDVSGCEHLYGDDSCDVLEFPSIYCAKNNCRYKELKHLQRENKEKIDIIEQMIKILYPNASDDELYDVAFNGEYIDKLKELKDTADTMLMANDIKKQDIDSLQEANARLEQENKELKKQIESQKGLITVGGKQQYEYLQRVDELEQENKRYKQLLQGCPADGNDCGFCEIDKRNKELKEKVKSRENELANMAEQANMRINTYRSALEEIRILATKNVSIENFIKIQNKINEVLGNESK